ncbi:MULTISPECIES: F0F1 ATP synthase subunit A [Clostridium]|uniref:ATP synthase subunit a n=1 Tax=Clostridium paridis TaxID=2803863 RepID=A0A937FGR0_9CLOT|nr:MULTISPECIES: F0F1 ATP synthase subunit A [Clostridium]MBL4932680.1 F0F1 ATP synthase subunit A [Clostridium paridis]MDD7792696.1 F0F1 ATP synthase subunit A [Clostridium sp. 'White wine YQ']
MEKVEPLVSFYLGNFKVDITIQVVIEWIVMILIIALAIWSTNSLKKKPSKKQTVVEMAYEALSGMVKDNMGEGYQGFVPFIGTLGAFILLMNLTGLVGIAPPTSNYSVTIAFAVMTFLIVNANALKKVGVKHYLGGLCEPFPVMLPINIIERLMLPVSLSLRLFGNILAGTVLLDLVYMALGSVLAGVFKLGVPVFLHAYFDLFDGLIQAFIFMMLTMINTKITAEH